MLNALLITLLHRPYVFAFLVSFLVIGTLRRGLGRTLLFLTVGFSVAWLSEFSSIRNGFPYGMYHYVYENLKGELLLGGVPVWDSLSYSFMAYAAFEMGEWLKIHPAFLMVLLDIVADPLAVRGDRWFLGRIFYYPNGGLYFGVPLSNFAGWFLVALTIFSMYYFLESKLFKPHPQTVPGTRLTGTKGMIPLLGPLFYESLVLFNLAITFWIGEVQLGLVGLLIHLTILIPSLFKRARFLARPPA